MSGYQKSVKEAWFILNRIVNNTCPQLKAKNLWNSVKLYNWVKYFDREIKIFTKCLDSRFQQFIFSFSRSQPLIEILLISDWIKAMSSLSCFYLNQFKFRLACWHSLTFWWECPPPLGLVCQEQQYHCQVCANSQQE